MTNEHKSEHCPNSARRARLDLVAGRVWSGRSKIPLHGPDQTRPTDRLGLRQVRRLFLVGSGPNRTHPDTSLPATRSPTKSGPCEIPLYGHGPDRAGPDHTKSTDLSKTCGPNRSTFVGDPGRWPGLTFQSSQCTVKFHVSKFIPLGIPQVFLSSPRESSDIYCHNRRIPAMPASIQRAARNPNGDACGWVD